MTTLDYTIFDHLAQHCLRIATNGNFRRSGGENKFVITGFPSPSYNYIFLKDHTDGLLESIIAENIPFVCYSYPTPENIKEIFEKYGMTLIENVMAHELADLSSLIYSPDEKIEIRQVTTEEDLVALDNISHVCFNHEKGFANKFLYSMLKNKDCEMFLACMDSKPVGIGMLSVINNDAGLYRLGVLPEYRKAGIGSV